MGVIAGTYYQVIDLSFIKVRQVAAQNCTYRGVGTFFIKSTFWWPAYSPGVTSQNDYDFSM